MEYGVGKVDGGGDGRGLIEPLLNKALDPIQDPRLKDANCGCFASSLTPGTF